MKPLRKGFTTGTCAAAAAKAAAMALKESEVRSQKSKVWSKESEVRRGPLKIEDFFWQRSQESGEVMVDIVLPEGKRVSMTALIKEVREDYAIASVIKDAGDDPDVTDGAEIVAKVRRLVRSQKSGVKRDRRKTEDLLEHKSQGAEGIIIKGGRGVGVVTKPGLQIPVGEPAINPTPRKMIKEAVQEVLGETPVEVTIEVPDGRALAAKTFNPRLGIVGGISIIGTTGIVEPMSLEALKATVRCEIDVAIEESKVRSQESEGVPEKSKIFWGRGARSVLYLAPGKIGEDALKRLFGDIRVVQTSNFIGFALEYTKDKGIRNIVYGGHPGKLAKIMMGYYDTHSRNSPQATDFVAKYIGINGKFNTVEEIIKKTKASSESDLWSERFSHLARDIATKIGNDFGFSTVEVYIFDIKKELIGTGKWVG